MAVPLNTPFNLKERELLCIADSARREVKCLRGTLWITQEGDREDRVICGGESFILDRPGLSLVTAMRGAALLIVQLGSVIARHPLRRAA